MVGIISYAIWGIVRAVFDPPGKGHDLRSLLARFGFLVSAFGYAILGWPTYSYKTGASQTANGSQTQKFIGAIMAMPIGRWAIGILGLVILAGGLYQIYLGFDAGFEHQFSTYALSSEETKLVTNVEWFGISARGVVIALVGFLIALAGY